VKTPRLEDYAFVEALEGQEVHLLGLDKLRAIRDDVLRASLFELWKNLPPKSQAVTQQAKLFAPKPQMRPASRELVDREPMPAKPGKDPRLP
jgi:hypothetical protein